ncbi:MAG TPA: hypothetical protein VF254_09385 [Gammaproteobacteria bacterium]
MHSSDKAITRALRCVLIVLLGFSLLACSDDSGPAPGDNGDPGGQNDQSGDDNAGDDNDDDDPGDGDERPAATLSSDGTLGAQEPLTVTFSEAMDADSLHVGGTLAPDAVIEWTSASALTLTPRTYWPVGMQTLVIDAGNADGVAMDTLEAPLEVQSGFVTFQAAEVVIGQQDFTSGFARQDPEALSAGANTLDHPSSAVDYAAEEDILFIGDTFEARVLGFYGVPDVNNANADFVIGQADLNASGGETSREKVRRAQGISVQGDRLMIADPDSHRVTIYGPPLPPPGIVPADVVLGQANFEDFNNACGPLRMNHVHNQFVTPDGRLLVADSNNNRILVWNEIPEATGEVPDLVIGQSSLDTCAHNDDDQNGASLENGLPSARTLRHPTGIWSDGERLVIADNYNNRVLLWHEFPTGNFTPADVVLGQADMNSVIPNDDNGDGVSEAEPTARVVDYPWSVWFEQNQLFVADANNNRVLIWNGWPRESFAPADIVLGQESFDTGDINAGNANPTAQTLNHPMGVRVIGDELLVTDTDNSRVLIYGAE